MKYSAMAMIHSKNAIEEITVEDTNGNYIATTKDGIKCSAIYNPFTALYYADDIYCIIE